jgi:O-succinylbenzoic acid--CoA ligase
MDISANSSNRSRSVISVDPALAIGDVMNLVAKALAHQGPALNFTDESMESVDSDISLVVATTGSSGTRKSVALGSAALLASARASLNFLNARAGQTWALLMPMHHIAGINVLIRALELGTTPVDLRSAQNYPATDFSAVVPTQIYRALNGDEKLLAHLKSAKSVLVGGAQLHNDLLQQAKDAGISVVRTYGMSETSGGCIYEGTPLEGVDVRVSDSGLVEISGAILASGYLNNDDLWNQQYLDGWFTTSDLGKINSDGNVEVLGRADDVYITGGEKVSLSRVDEVLHNAFPQLQWCAVAVDDAQWGQRLVVAVSGAGAPAISEVSTLLSTALGDFAKPKQLLIFDEMPMIGIGKIDRMQICERAQEELNG